MTRTRKLRREFVEERYKDLIRGMYAGADEVKVDASVTYRDGRKGAVTTGIRIRTVSKG